MKIVQTTIADKIEGAAALLDEHWHESAKNKHLMVLKPDLAQYEALEATGNMVGLVAYDDTGAMVGYSVNIVGPHMHYADVLCAYNDVLFIASAYRGSRLGLQLIRETERACKARGCHLMLWHAKEETALSKILPALGCRVQEISYSKEL